STPWSCRWGAARPTRSIGRSRGGCPRSTPSVIAWRRAASTTRSSRAPARAARSEAADRRRRTMGEHALRWLLGEVKAARLDRRAFLRRMTELGLTAPMAARILASAGVAEAQPKTPAFQPTRRGGGGTLRLLYWQAPTILNPHLSTGVKDG